MLRALRATLFVVMWSVLGSALAAGNSITCTGSLPVSLVCMYERTNFQLLGAESAFGVVLDVDRERLDLAPYLVLGYYAENRAVVVELAMPKWGPVLGSPSWLSVSWSVRW